MAVEAEQIASEKGGDEQIKAEIIDNFKPIIEKWVNESPITFAFLHTHIPRSVLERSGTQGVCEAINGFDPAKQKNFEEYADYRVRKSVRGNFYESALEACQKTINKRVKEYLKKFWFLGSVIEREDLEQSGGEGIFEATIRFDPLQGNNFETAFKAYADWWVLNHIQENFYKAALRSTLRKMNEEIEKIKSGNRGKEPTDGEVAKAMGMPVDQISVLHQWFNKNISITGTDDPETDDGEFEKYPTVIPEDDLNVLDTIIRWQRRMIIFEAFNSSFINPIERALLAFHNKSVDSFYGDLTLVEFASELRVPAGLVLRIRERLLEKIEKHKRESMTNYKKDQKNSPYGGLTSKDIAAEFGKSDDNVRRIYKRIKEKRAKHKTAHTAIRDKSCQFCTFESKMEENDYTRDSIIYEASNKKEEY